MVRVRSVEIEPNFHLRLTFTNGETWCFDMRPYLDLPVFRRLRDPAFFALAHVEYGTVVWPGAIDIAPETLYERSMAVVRTETSHHA